MNSQRTLLALAAVIVGGAVLSRKAGAAEFGDDIIKEITVTAQRLGKDGLASLLGADTRTLGLRNNNPMNIRETNITWLGELPHDGDGYENFGTAADGIRAGARVLINYFRQHSIRTVRGVITRWAPTFENPTAEYINFVAKRIGISADAVLDMTSADTITQLSDAIIAFENGEQPFTKSFIRDNVKRAF